MFDLALELSLLILLAACIGWFTGRFMCKSGEHLVRAEKRQLEQRITALEADLKRGNQQLLTSQEQISEQHAQVNGLEQQCDSLNSRIEALREERKILLDKQQSLEL